MPTTAHIEEIISRTLTESITDFEQITPASPANRDGIIIFAPDGAIAIRMIETGGSAPTGSYAPSASDDATFKADLVLESGKTVTLAIQDSIDVYAAAISGTACAVVEEYR